MRTSDSKDTLNYNGSTCFSVVAIPSSVQLLQLMRYSVGRIVNCLENLLPLSVEVGGLLHKPEKN